MNLDKIKLPNTYFKKGNFFYFCKNSPKNGVKSFIDFFISKKFIQIKELLIKKNSIYLYCNSRFSAAVERIINKNKFSVKGVIDDSKILKKSNYTEQSFKFKKILKLRKNLVMWDCCCHQEIISKKIKSKLIKKGFK